MERGYRSRDANSSQIRKRKAQNKARRDKEIRAEISFTLQGTKDKEKCWF